jgi:pimeloyl-ACP methyl ester carboxylesterase
MLKAHAWTKWDEIPALDDNSTPLGKAMRRTHLRVQVWELSSQKLIVVAFGGTKNWKDFLADFRWRLRLFRIPTLDQYEVMFEEFVPIFADTLITRLGKLGDSTNSRPYRILATGHSLGGGLAQGFAYAYNAHRKTLDHKIPPVRTVIAFNTSPVSGKRDIQHWRSVASDIIVQRIYHRGEILAILRAIFNILIRPQKDNASFVDIRYATHWTWKTMLPVVGWVSAHFMRKLAETMVENAGARGFAFADPECLFPGPNVDEVHAARETLSDF